eukprot:TRINITY_DN9058_c0_g1_i3.p1 TRINITY_DN9058_c0_g1~~TRINITY_DN9058_c0_g1_i3.p1  ORF type:complete len:198 (+),score=42.70 TRINITY_DN9058_c0_g1_i3:49-642(+)
MMKYGSLEFWDTRYTRELTPFDWYTCYPPELKYIVNENVDNLDKVLHIGCGNSLLSEQLVRDGYQSIHNIDISPVVIEQMRNKYNDPRLIYEEMDFTDMRFPNEHFAAVIDKAGMDSLLCGEKSSDAVKKMLKEVKRVLVRGGKFIIISHSRPENRLKYFKDPSWVVNTQTIPKEYAHLCVDDVLPYHFVYIVTKNK